MSFNSDYLKVGLGNQVQIKTNNVKHFAEKPVKAADDDVSTSFKDMLSEAVGKVNNLQVEAEGVTQKMIYEPESVDMHTVMLAAQKAEIALTFTKTIRDEAIKAYRELMSLR